MTRSRYRAVKKKERDALAEQIRQSFSDREANYVRCLTHIQAYLRSDYSIFHFIATRCQIYGVYSIKCLEISKITGVDRRYVRGIIYKLIDMGFLMEVDEKYDPDIITVDLDGIESFKKMSSGVEEFGLVELRMKIGDNYFPECFEKYKKELKPCYLTKKKVS